jgi:hypothetical protein
MDAESILEAIAEIGVALAGFAGIVGAVAGQRLHSGDSRVWLPFWVMISGGLSIVFAALFPFLPYHFGAAERVLWASSSAYVALLTTVSLVFFVPRFLRVRRDSPLSRMLVFEILLYLLSFALLVSQFLNAAGVGLSQSVGGFLAGLYLMLLISALNFVFLLYVLGSSHRVPRAVEMSYSRETISSAAPTRATE